MKKKKLTALLLVFAMSIILCACGGDKPETTEGTTTSEESTEEQQKKDVYGIGDNIETDIFSYSITSAEFVDGIVCDEGEDFFTPNTEGSHVLNAGEGYKLLYFTAEYQYKGKSSLDSTMISSLFSPTVKYEDYTFDSNYFVFQKVGDSWYNQCTDIDWSVRENYGLDLPTTHFTYEPLEDKLYEVRGAVSIPNQAFEDSEAEMILSLALCYNAEQNNTYLDFYDFKIR